MSSKKILQLKLSDLSGNGWSEEHLTIIKYVGLQTDLTVPIIISKLNEYKGDYKKLVTDYKRDQIIDMVIRQTNYTRQEAYDKLVEEKGDYTKVINNYICSNTKKEEDNVILNNKSTNQQIFKEIRNFMDDVNNKYEYRKNMNERKQLSQEIITNVLKDKGMIEEKQLSKDNEIIKDNEML